MVDDAVAPTHASATEALSSFASLLRYEDIPADVVADRMAQKLIGRG